MPWKKIKKRFSEVTLYKFCSLRHVWQYENDRVVARTCVNNSRFVQCYVRRNAHQ